VSRGCQYDTGVLLWVQNTNQFAQLFLDKFDRWQQIGIIRDNHGGVIGVAKSIAEQVHSNVDI